MRLPFYDKKKKCWKVTVDGRHEYGDLVYICGEFANTGLYYPFHTQDLPCEFEEHEHDFEGVLLALLDNPYTFSIKGFEEYYSAQEIDMLNDIQRRLHEVKKHGRVNR